MNEKEYEILKKDYKEGKVKLSIDLAKARQILLMEVKYIPAIFLHFLIYAIVFACCIYSFFVLKWFGILYSIVFIILWFSYMGLCSTSKEKSKAIYVLLAGIAITIICLFLLGVEIALLIGLSFLGLYITYYLYQFSAKILLHYFILEDLNYFNRWNNDVFFIMPR